MNVDLDIIEKISSLVYVFFDNCVDEFNYKSDDIKITINDYRIICSSGTFNLTLDTDHIAYKIMIRNKPNKITHKNCTYINNDLILSDGSSVDLSNKTLSTEEHFMYNTISELPSISELDEYCKILKYCESREFRIELEIFKNSKDDINKVLKILEDSRK